MQTPYMFVYAYFTTHTHNYVRFQRLNESKRETDVGIVEHVCTPSIKEAE